jgi:hypothetical protein
MVVVANEVAGELIGLVLRETFKECESEVAGCWSIGAARPVCIEEKSKAEIGCW